MPDDTESLSDCPRPSPSEMMLQVLLGSSTPAGRGTGWVPPAPQELSRLLPQYQVEGILGRGGMGVVYRGMQTLLRRPVAIKLLPAELAADADFTARFEREARTLAALQHPGIVTVYESGQTSEGHFYFVMELVDGTDLAHLIRNRGLEPEQAMQLMGQICDALQYAHAQGVIHRDIKPANVLITRNGHAKLADFGLARPADATEQTMLTATHVIMGTPDYMAPEQMMGIIDQRTDIYALGIMFYQMLTGRVPKGRFAMPSTLGHSDPRLDAVVIKAIQHFPEHRFQDVREIKRAVLQIRMTLVPMVQRADVPQQLRVIPQQLAPTLPAKKRTPAVVWIVLLTLISIGAWLFFKPGEPAIHDATEAMKTMKSASNASSGPSGRPAGAFANVLDMKNVSRVSSQGTAGSSISATSEPPLVNTLGMKFVPVPGTQVLMCIHETRKADYAKFAAANDRHDISWKTPFKSITPGAGGDEVPVVCVSWDDAKDFCVWLSKKERRSYRLPMDREWSFAVGIGHVEPAQSVPVYLDQKVLGEYPWGQRWPPTGKVGNFADTTAGESLAAPLIIDGYTDGHATLARVMSFQPNKLALYDMGGNVWEWCEDSYDLSAGNRVLRGGSWGDAKAATLLSSKRLFRPSGYRDRYCGFRCVIVSTGTRNLQGPDEMQPGPARELVAPVGTR